MMKFKELLLLKSLYRVGNKTINKTYKDLLEETDTIEDLINSKELSNKKKEIDEKYDKVDALAESIIDDPEITIITIFDENYPKKLNILGNKKPPILYVKGDVNALSKPNISVIGTRKPSDVSKEFEKAMVKSVLDVSDRAVVSGLALGCDKIAHQTTVDENKVTIAFLPSGVNVITPASHEDLANDIIEKGGCLVSEYEPFKKANKGSFVDRDKIVAAFSDILFVVQCGFKSGTMHTVNAFLDFKTKPEFKADLYAYLPENIRESDYSGNISIIKRGQGTKVTDIESFCEEIEILEIDIEEKVEPEPKVKNKPKDKQSTLGF